MESWSTRSRRRKPPESIYTPLDMSSYLCPNAYKLYDFRTEVGFAEIARETIGHGRIGQDYSRLCVLWLAVKNTVQVDHSVAEVGVFRGGSSRFIAASFKQSNQFPAIHVFDTFEGHPDIVDPVRDSHSKGWFSETSYESVKKYLA